MTLAIAVAVLGGLALLVAGAEILVRGASALAMRFGVPPLVVGLTVVAFGTSAPEIGVSVEAALDGRDDVCVGNVVGSNTFNVLLILGLSALVAPLAVARKLVQVDIPVMIGTAMLAAWLASDGVVSRVEGAVMLALLVVFTWAAIRLARGDAPARDEPPAEAPRRHAAVDAVFVLGGLALLVAGSKWFVGGASDLARAFGVDELTIGLTLVAAGTSMPEVATSILASARGQRDIAVGNVVGSNIFNVLGVLGAAAVATGDGVAVTRTALAFDFPVMLAVVAACLPLAWTGFRIGRREGAVLVGLYVAWTGFLVLDAKRHHAVPDYGRVMTTFVIPAVVAGIAVSVFLAFRRGNGRAAP
ncbi:MAG: Inner membrane protein YrbG [Planctomycetes bacterium]|nr:Inner membrane protein YrbG [Planctomycetota bacterium]